VEGEENGIIYTYASLIGLDDHIGDNRDGSTEEKDSEGCIFECVPHEGQQTYYK
jgi:hypothetical protein